MFQWPIVSVLSLYGFILQVFCSVPPPTNLTLNCHNFHNVLYWNYSEPSLQPLFIVTIRNYEGPRQLVNTSKNYLDISSYTQDADDAYFVSVVATLNESAIHSSGRSTQFTYGEFSSKTKCTVDFPPLNISVWSRRFEINYRHPFYIYGIETLNDTFIYSVEYNETESTIYSCLVTELVCTEKMHLPESLYGSCMMVHFKGSVKGIQTDISRNVCSDRLDPNEKDWTTIITTLVCSGIVVIMIIVVGGVLYKKRTQIKPQNSVISKFLSIVRSDHAMIVPEQPTLCAVTSVGHIPLLQTPDDVPTPTNISPTDVTHFPIDSIPNMESSGSQEPESMVEEEESEDAKSSTGYDCGKFLVVMSPGDTVDAYGPRQA
ncbi:interferon gamma receptor 1-like [Electrophorus electricus]|uniref:interferon gamma receptor 1-like n=1 Tax=Electrophorus electricus TaxID=8005 RepID=UPI0015CFD18D|nr:interferon gamma receptor 1-like [Electrophorus electricus]